MRVVLASASPRRRELLAALGLDFTVATADVDEAAVARGHAPVEAAALVAAAKARVVAAAHGDALVLAADTIVVLDGAVLGKPRDAAEAAAMLERLCDRTHAVHTGVVVRWAEDEQREVATTEVRMRAYGGAEIAAYVASGSPLDKAGAYGIQDESFRPVASLAGCYCNVVGLPLWTVRRMLARAGVLTVRRPDQGLACCAACPLAA